MDRISLLPDELLSHILSLVPTKDAVVTSVLSKRWLSVWMVVPKLDYDDSNCRTNYGRFLRFVDRSMLLHEAQHIESLRLKVGLQCSSADINTWLTFAVRRRVRELEIHYSSVQVTIRLPRILYIWETLVVLKLNNTRIVDVPFRVCFPKLKTLHLREMKYPDNESFRRLLSSCPTLEDMVVVLHSHDNLTTLTVKVPTLQRLALDRGASEDLEEFEIHAPSLKYFEMEDYRNDDCLDLYVPEVVEAHVWDTSDTHPKFFGHLTSVRRLRLGLFPETVYQTGCILHQLVHLELLTFSFGWNLVMCLLEHCPKLHVFRLEQDHNESEVRPEEDFEEPDIVPKCLLFHLETFIWRGYAGAELEKEMATYILKNALNLKTATFFLRGSVKKLRVMRELELSPRVDTCQLVFASSLVSST